MKYLWSYMKRNKGQLALIIGLLIVQTIGTLLVPYLVAGMIDKGIMNKDLEMVVFISIQMLIVAIVTSVVMIWSSYASADFGADFGRNMREGLFRKTQELSIHDLDEIGISSLITRTTGDITNIQQAIVMVLQLIITAPMMAAVAIVMSAKVNFEITMVLLASILILLFISVIVFKKSQVLSSKIQVGMDKINQVLRESIIGVRVIRAFDNASFEKNRSDDSFKGYANIMISLNRLFAAMNPVVWLIMGLTMAAIVAFGGIKTAHGNMGIGEITSVIEYAMMTLGYLIMAISSVVTLPKTKACLDRLNEVLDMKATIQDHPQSVHLKNRIKKLKFEDVSFSYQGAQMAVLQNVSFCCESGKRTAIIGSTGSGKSTLAALLQRLHDVDSGKILMDGVSIANLSQHDLREKIGYIPQKAYLFSGTIADNLQMGKKDASEEEMWQAIRVAQAESFVTSLPERLYTNVSQGGTNFSGGQRQRLAIARALIRKASVLIFDDSFSALDFKTDAALRETLKNEVKDTITIVIAQRISTIQDADQIIVLDEGSIAGIGTHSELMKSCDIYREIASSQNAQKEGVEDEKK